MGNANVNSTSLNYERRSPTVLRTFRLLRELNASLEVEAKNRGLSVNALVSSLITKFDSWDRFADRFHFVSLTDDVLQLILAQSSDEQIAQIADTVGARIVGEGMMFWYKEATVESLITYLNNRCRYAGYGNLEYEKKGNTHVIALQHRLGIKWSIYLHHIIDNVLRKRLGIVGRFETSESSVIVHFTD